MNGSQSGGDSKQDQSQQSIAIATGLLIAIATAARKLDSLYRDRWRVSRVQRVLSQQERTSRLTGDLIKWYELSTKDLKLKPISDDLDISNSRYQLVGLTRPAIHVTILVIICIVLIVCAYLLVCRFALATLLQLTVAFVVDHWIVYNQ